MSEERPLRDPLLKSLAPRLAAANELAGRVAGGLSDAQRRWSPSLKVWSIDLCLEHLTLSAEKMLEKMEPAFTTRREAVRAERRPWKASFFGRFIANAVDPANKKKMSAPSVFRPPPQARRHVLEAFLRVQQRVALFLRDADGSDLGAVRFSSPAARFIRMNLGDGFKIIVLHAERHLRQAERLRAHPAFPKG